MSKLITMIILAFVLLADFTLAQSNPKSSKEVSYLDSVIYYFQQCQTTKGIDTVIFDKAINILGQMNISRISINQIEIISHDFKKKNKHWLSNIIDHTLLYNITRSDSTDMAISYCKNIINNYDISGNPDERFRSLP